MGIIDTAYDGSSVAVRLGGTKAPGNKLEWGESVKVDKLKRFGQMAPAARTQGSLELKEVKLTIEVGVMRRLVIPKLPANGFTMFQFQITAQQNHPDLGAYSVILDRCRFIGLDEALEASEKASMMDVMIDTMLVLRKGADGIWKTLGVNPDLPSPQAAAFML